MSSQTFKLDKAMITEPRLLPVSAKSKPKWSSIGNDITLTIYTLPYTSVEMHLIHRGKFIIKQTFSPLSTSSSAVRRITCGPSSAAVRYDSIQTPMISGLKMQETFQLAFNSADDCGSFLRLMQGFFNIVPTKTPQGQGFSQKPSQLLISSPSKASTSRSFPFSSPTKSINRETSSQFQPPPISTPAKRSNINTKIKSTLYQAPEAPPATIDSSMQEKQVGKVQLGEEVSPSPPSDEATERLKRGLLGNFKPSPTPPDEELNRTEPESSSPRRDKNEKFESYSAYEDKGVMTTDVRPSSSYARKIPSGSQDRSKIRISTPDQPLISFSQSPDNSLDPIIHASTSQQTQNITTPSKTFSLQEGFSERIPEASHPVMLTQGESEAERVRRGKRKRDELEDELEEEGLISQNSHSSGLPHHTYTSKYPSAPPRSSYPRGMYDMSSSDLEGFVFGVVLEQGFEPLLSRIVLLMEAKLEVMSQTQSHQRHYTEQTAPPQQAIITKNESPYQQEDTNRCTGLDADPEHHDYLHNPFHNPHSQYDVHHSRERQSQASAQSSSSHYYSVPADFQSQSQTHACASRSLHRSSAYTAKHQPKYSQGVQDHSQTLQQRSHDVLDGSNPAEQSRIYSRHSQNHSLVLQDQSQQHQPFPKSPSSSHVNHSQPPADPSQVVDNPQYTQPGNSYPEYDYDQEEYSVFPRSPAKPSIGYILNETETQTQTQGSAFSPAQPSTYNQMNNTFTHELTYDNPTNKFDEEDEEIANISREFDLNISPGSSIAHHQGEDEGEEEEKEYNYDDEDSELEKEIEEGV